MSRVISDLHIHSKYSRATSQEMDVVHLDKWAKIKGIKVIGTGDFTHPQWVKELKEKLEPAENGLYKIKKSASSTRFILTAEISCIYSKNGATRKIHILVVAPSFGAAEKINTHLGWIGNLKSDGRPILGLDAKELTKIVLDICEDCLIIPAHIWTPWFSLFGSKSGFNSIEECFEEYSKYIYAAETGLSSNPAMNWRLSMLDNVTLISNSDSHSPAKIGREANVFDIDSLCFSEIARILKKKDKKKFLYTVEFYPQEGKYHYDGHRNCSFGCSPEQTKKYGGVCPVCGKLLTVGVSYRVDELADRAPENGDEEKPYKIPFVSLVPLQEIIAESLGMSESSKRVKDYYKKLILELGNEFNILLDVDPKQIGSVSLPEIAEGVIRVREGRVYINPGYDGQYGKVRIFEKGEQKSINKQETLF